LSPIDAAKSLALTKNKDKNLKLFMYFSEIALGTWENGGCVVIPKTPEEAVKFQKEHAATALVGTR